MSHPVTVTHQLGSYPVYVEPGLLQQLTRLAQEHLSRRRVAMVADATVHQLYQAGRFGRPTWTGETLCVPPGEPSKSRETWTTLSDTLLNKGYGRDSGLIGLGGGMVGDLAGFVAATYMRGLPYILVPTTLLAMVDASVGGKTGVNTRHGKNLIGAFHPPSAVLADPLTLTTLPEREYRGGLAEAVKHGLIADHSYFEWIESKVESLLRREPKDLEHLVRRSVEIKAAVVSEDEREAGRRAILNAGHTIGHGLEAASHYQLSHGEAVSLGLIGESAIADRMNVADAEVHRRVLTLLQRLGLPVKLPHPVDLEAVLETMAADKKNRNGEVHCSLIAGVGRMHHSSGWTTAVSRALMEEVLRSLT
jgi:3-dehydroquinate synthase